MTTPEMESESVFSSRPTPQGKNRAMVSSRKKAGLLHCAEQDRCESWKCERELECR